ncbi:hypothetical protein FQN52_006369 [Onygenales sp. PD_12]|nr:hypothetical protein FQN52_006369 [Onygenales sp. PD_12]
MLVWITTANELIMTWALIDSGAKCNFISQIFKAVNMCYKSISANAVEFIKPEEFKDVVHTGSITFIIHPCNLNLSGEPVMFFGGITVTKFKLPAPYEEYVELFDENSDLAAHTPHDHAINIELGKDPPY